jgi:hypothetical protein
MEKHPKTAHVTVENLTNSLAQIEIWVKAVRAALSSLDPKLEIRLSSPELRVWTEDEMSPIRTGRECPPPE